MQCERATVESEKEIVELRALIEWLKDENSRIKARNRVLEDRSRELRRSSEEKDELIFRLTENETLLKGMSVRLKERSEAQKKDSERREKERVEEVKNLGDKCWQLRVEKRKLEIEVEAVKGTIAAGDEALEIMKKAAKEEIDSMKSLVEERDGTVTKLMRENEGYKKEKNREIETLLNEKMVLTKIMQEVNQKFSVLAERTGALEKEVDLVKDECLKLKREKNTEIARIVDEKIALEAQMRRKDEQGKEKTSELIQRIEVLEREKMEVEVEISKEKRERFKEIKRILVLKMALEARKRYAEGEKEKATSKLLQRISLLEREKQGLEAEVKEKDEVIQVIKEENERLVATVPNNGHDSAVFAHPDGKMGSQTCSLTQNIVDKFEVKIAGSNARKRKHPARSSDGGDLDEDTVIGKSMKSTRGLHNPTGLSVDQDLLDAFDSDHQLCLKAVCALYRQHMRFARSNSLSPSSEEKVFKPEFVSKAIALAEYLTDENPEGGLKKSLADLDRLDPKAVEECVKIAKQHYKQVFKIYQKDHLMFLA